jgi:hypothetical protein
MGEWWQQNGQNWERRDGARAVWCRVTPRGCEPREGWMGMGPPPEWTLLELNGKMAHFPDPEAATFAADFEWPVLMPA